MLIYHSSGPTVVPRECLVTLVCHTGFDRPPGVSGTRQGFSTEGEHKIIAHFQLVLVLKGYVQQ